MSATRSASSTASRTAPAAGMARRTSVSAPRPTVRSRGARIADHPSGWASCHAATMRRSVVLRPLRAGPMIRTCSPSGTSSSTVAPLSKPSPTGSSTPTSPSVRPRESMPASTHVGSTSIGRRSRQRLHGCGAAAHPDDLGQQPRGDGEATGDRRRHVGGGEAPCRRLVAVDEVVQPAAWAVRQDGGRHGARLPGGQHGDDPTTGAVGDDPLQRVALDRGVGVGQPIAQLAVAVDHQQDRRCVTGLAVVDLVAQAQQQAAQPLALVEPDHGGAARVRGEGGEGVAALWRARQHGGAQALSSRQRPGRRGAERRGIPRQARRATSAAPARRGVGLRLRSRRARARGRATRSDKLVATCATTCSSRSAWPTPTSSFRPTRLSATPRRCRTIPTPASRNR